MDIHRHKSKIKGKCLWSNEYLLLIKKYVGGWVVCQWGREVGVESREFFCHSTVSMLGRGLLTSQPLPVVSFRFSPASLGLDP